MSGEPTALELADWLDDVNRTADIGDDCDEWLSAAADELRRQHAVIEAIVAIPDDVGRPRDMPNAGWCDDVAYGQRVGAQQMFDTFVERITAVIESGGAS